jgi:hypothetical protein
MLDYLLPLFAGLVMATKKSKGKAKKGAHRKKKARGTRTVLVNFLNAVIDPVTSDTDANDGIQYTFFSINNKAAFLWRPFGDFALFDSAQKNGCRLDGAYDKSSTRTPTNAPANISADLVTYDIHG